MEDMIEREREMDEKMSAGKWVKGRGREGVSSKSSTNPLSMTMIWVISQYLRQRQDLRELMWERVMMRLERMIVVLPVIRCSH